MFSCPHTFFYQFEVALCMQLSMMQIIQKLSSVFTGNLGIFLTYTSYHVPKLPYTFIKCMRAQLCEIALCCQPVELNRLLCKAKKYVGHTNIGAILLICKTPQTCYNIQSGCLNIEKTRSKKSKMKFASSSCRDLVFQLMSM